MIWGAPHPVLEPPSLVLHLAQAELPLNLIIEISIKY